VGAFACDLADNPATPLVHLPISFLLALASLPGCRGFNEAVNAFADDGWVAAPGDGSDDVSVSLRPAGGGSPVCTQRGRGASWGGPAPEWARGEGADHERREPGHVGGRALRQGLHAHPGASFLTPSPVRNLCVPNMHLAFLVSQVAPEQHVPVFVSLPPLLLRSPTHSICQ